MRMDVAIQSCQGTRHADLFLHDNQVYLDYIPCKFFSFVRIEEEQTPNHIPVFLGRIVISPFSLGISGPLVICIQYPCRLVQHIHVDYYNPEDFTHQ